MKKILNLLCIGLLVWSCQTETIEEAGLSTADLKMEKVSVCHYSDEDNSYQIKYVNGNSLDAHLAHGDFLLIDEDGDGYVTSENMCGIPVDCDDKDASKKDCCSIFDCLKGCYADFIDADTFGTGKGTIYRGKDEPDSINLFIKNDCDGDGNIIQIVADYSSNTYQCRYIIDGETNTFGDFYISADAFAQIRSEFDAIVAELGLQLGANCI